MNRYSVVLWDLDGTLTDPKEGITRCIRHALERLGLEAPPCDELEWAIGPPLGRSFQKLLEGDAELVARALSLYRERFASVGMYENRVYEGIPELLRDLASNGVRNVLTTSKPGVYAEKILAHFWLDGYFHAVVGSSLDGSNVDKEDLVRLATERVPGFALREIVMVGDRKYDIAGAKANGVDSVGVLYGYGSRKELEEAEPAALVETVGGLRELLLPVSKAARTCGE